MYGTNQTRGALIPTFKIINYSVTPMSQPPNRKHRVLIGINKENETLRRKQSRNLTKWSG